MTKGNRCDISTNFKYNTLTINCMFNGIPFFAKNHCRYGVIALPLHRNRDAISL